MSEEEIINILSDEIVSLNVGHEKYEQAVKGLLDLYNKEKEKNKGISKLEADLYECNNIISDYIDVVRKKDKIINKMAEQLRGMAVLDTDKDEMIILGDDEDVIKYYERKVKQCQMKKEKHLKV